ncbi:MAG TPA: exodeoxyribonuclease VII large subunit, partial [Saprospiraceae bacterium]|nr:exodeoxyribonuclease VII large subunit [Saprospiraceae bacterium]
MESVSLFELNEFIRRVLALNFPEAVWLRAEIAQISQARGHFFIDLVEKENEGEGIIAQAAASLWSRQHKMLSKKYPDTIETLLSEGMEVLLRVKVDFHERYGLKLIV